MENTEQQPTTTTTLPQIATIQNIPNLVSTNLPAMQNGSKAAVAAMQAITQITTDEEYEHANNLLVRVSLTEKKVVALRKAITTIMDDAKDFLMESERPLQDGKDTP